MLDNLLHRGEKNLTTCFVLFGVFFSTGNILSWKLTTQTVLLISFLLGVLICSGTLTGNALNDLDRIGIENRFQIFQSFGIKFIMRSSNTCSIHA